MDGLELRQTLMQSLTLGMAAVADERKETESVFYYAELTGRMDAMSTMLEFLVNVDVGTSNGNSEEEAK